VIMPGRRCSGFRSIWLPGCWNYVDPRAFALGRSVNTNWDADLDLRRCWALHGGDRGRDHRPGNDSAATAAIKINDQTRVGSRRSAASIRLRSRRTTSVPSCIWLPWYLCFPIWILGPRRASRHLCRDASQRSRRYYWRWVSAWRSGLRNWVVPRTATDACGVTAAPPRSHMIICTSS
jgi:hypothetical protein